MPTRSEPTKVQARALPATGVATDRILETMSAAARNDVNWRDGQAWSLVFHAGDELAQLTKQAYAKFFYENGVNPMAFPSLRKFEAEVVSMVCHLLGGDGRVVGNMTSGGTESILMAVKTAREWARARQPKNTKPEMVMPVTAHPAFDKAGHYFSVKPVHVAVAKNYRANVRAMKKAVNKHTILLVGSAPSYPHGVVDPIEELGQLARKRRLPLHVDACVGGMMLPFVRALGHRVTPFDFSVPGVTSISVDLHKYGYAAKGASVVLYRNAKIRRHQFFAYTDWPGGIYASPTMTGTRPGGAIAAAWAVMNRLGFEGYREIAREVMATTRRLQEGIDSIEGIAVLGHPEMSILAIGSQQVDIYEVADHMTERGWHLDRQQFPPSLHLTINYAHIRSADRFLDDLREAVKLSRKPRFERLVDKSRTFFTSTAARVLPAAIVSKVTTVVSEKLGVEGGALPAKTAPMYGMMATLPNRGDVQKVVLDILDQLTRPDQQPRGSSRLR